jgi:hypothetical protein
MRKIIIIFILFYLSSVDHAGSDILHTSNDDIIEGVIVEETQNKIIIAMLQGDAEIDKGNINKIEYSSREENLVFLADIALNNNDYAKAYYLYEKALILDPDFTKAAEKIKALEPYIVRQSGRKHWEAFYEHFQWGKNDVFIDNDMVTKNSLQTEKLMQDFGLILDKSAGKIIVREAIRDKKAYSAGMRPNDYLKDINGKNADYMGVFDAIDAITAHEHTKLIAERLLKCWITPGSMEESALTKAKYGLTLSHTCKGFAVTYISKDSLFNGTGLSVGDIIISINGNDCSTFSADSVFDMFKNSQGSYIYLTINREIHLYT